MTPARLRAIAAMLPGYVCGQIETLADAWERDLADVDRFRAMAREYMDERDQLRRELDDARINLRTAQAVVDVLRVRLGGLSR